MVMSVGRTDAEPGQGALDVPAPAFRTNRFGFVGSHSDQQFKVSAAIFALISVNRHIFSAS